jgi:hypothetical protein
MRAKVARARVVVSPALLSLRLLLLSFLLMAAGRPSSLSWRRGSGRACAMKALVRTSKTLGTRATTSWGTCLRTEAEAEAENKARKGTPPGRPRGSRMLLPEPLWVHPHCWGDLCIAPLYSQGSISTRDFHPPSTAQHY